MQIVLTWRKWVLNVTNGAGYLSKLDEVWTLFIIQLDSSSNCILHPTLFFIQLYSSSQIELTQWKLMTEELFLCGVACSWTHCILPNKIWSRNWNLQSKFNLHDSASSIVEVCRTRRSWMYSHHSSSVLVYTNSITASRPVISTFNRSSNRPYNINP